MINIHTKYGQKLITVSLVGFLSACQSIPENIGGEEGPLFRRGVLSVQNDQLLFKPCYVRAQEQVIDHTGQLKNKVENTIGGALYAELSGDKLSSKRPWDIYKVHLMGGNQFTCFYELQGNQFRAAGDSPTWIADIRSDGIYVQSFKDLAQLIFPISEPLHIDQSLEWHSSLQAGRFNDITLRFIEEPCRDKHGIYYEYQAEMTLNGQTYEGCGREGDLGQRTLPGLYQVTLPNTVSPERQFALDLLTDGHVVLTQNYFNDQPLIVQKGTWKLLPKNKVVVYLVAEKKQGDNEVLLFDRHRLGGLVLQGYSSTYGKAGLTFHREGPGRSHRAEELEPASDELEETQPDASESAVTDSPTKSL